MGDTPTNKLKRSRQATLRLASKAWPMVRKVLRKAALPLMVAVADDIAVSTAQALLTAIANLG